MCAEWDFEHPESWLLLTHISSDIWNAHVLAQDSYKLDVLISSFWSTRVLRKCLETIPLIYWRSKFVSSYPPMLCVIFFIERCKHVFSSHLLCGPGSPFGWFSGPFYICSFNHPYCSVMHKGLSCFLSSTGANVSAECFSLKRGWKISYFYISWRVSLKLAVT